MAFTVQYRQVPGDDDEARWTYVIVEDGGYQYPGSASRTFATKEEAEAEAETAVTALERFIKLLRHD
jgi:hypothetical protein